MTGAVRVSLDVSAVPTRPAGAGRYILRLAEGLAGRDDVALRLWCRRDDAARWSGPSGAGEGATVRSVVPRWRPLRLGWEQLRLPGLLAGTDAEVHHGPHYTMPERARLATVVTIHDLTFVTHPEWHERSKVRLFRRAIDVAARRATALVCVSTATASSLEELRRPRGRVFVVPHGVDRHLFGSEEPAPGFDRAVVDRLGVRPPYVLFVGTVEPRKAVPDLVAAFDRLAGDRPDLSLVLVGRPGWGEAEVERSIASSRHGARVVRAGYLPDPDVAALLRSAAVAAYPSRQEGFGLPALEALACGAPLVTTAGTAMAEVTEEAALLVAPGSPADLADALASVLGGGEAVAARRERGLAVAARYDWEAVAARHAEVYRWAAAQGGTGGGPPEADR